MKGSFFLILLFAGFYFQHPLNAQNEEFTNTYVNTFNDYFYPWGVEPINQSSQSYNPFLQFSLFYPYGTAGCLPINYNFNPYDDSRFNIVNYNFPVINGWSPDIYCNRGIETGPGVNNSGSIRISIRGIDDNAGGIPNDGSDTRSRVEMCYYPKHFDKSTQEYTANVLNQVYYYRWDFFIPNNGDFVDQIVTDSNGDKISHHIISQFHQPSWEETFDPNTGVRTSNPQQNPVNLVSGDQPPIFINYKHEENATNNKRDILFLYGYRNSEDGCDTGTICDRSSHFSLEDGINKGQWNSIILEIKWSPIDTIGYMKIWVNGISVENSYESINVESNNPNYLTSEPTKIKGANMLLTQEGVPLSNFMQMGHYRDHLDTEATIYFDDLIITQNRSFAFSGFKTTLKSKYCNATLNVEQMKISANALPNVSYYKFRFEEVGNEGNVLVVHRSLNEYNLLDNPNYFKPNIEYRVKVAVKVEGENDYRNYDLENICKIRTPKETNLEEEYCNTIIMVEDMVIKCHQIFGATNYKFRFLSEDNTLYWSDRSIPEVDLRNLYFTQPDETYQVQVRAEGEGFSFPYGDVCQITISDLTQIKPQYCGDEYNINDIISCFSLPNAVGYKFRFKNDNGQYAYVDSFTSTIQIPNSSFFLQGGVFLVDVKHVNGNYGEVCSIEIISDFQFPKINESQDLSEHVMVYPNPFYNEIRFLTNDSAKSIEVYTVDGKLIFKKDIENNQRKINLDFLSEGTYLFLLKSKSNNEILKTKIIKK